MTLTGKSMFMAKPHSSIKPDADDTQMVQDDDGTLVTQKEYERRLKSRIEEAQRAAANRGN